MQTFIDKCIVVYLLLSVLTVQQRIIYLYRNIINIRCGIIFPAQSTHNLCTHRMQAKHPPPPFPVLWSDSLTVLTWILVVKVFSPKWPMWNSPNYNLSMWSKVSLWIHFPTKSHGMKTSIQNWMLRIGMFWFNMSIW